LRKIESFEFPKIYAYVKPYLLSKYYLYYGQDVQSIDLAVSFAYESITNADSACPEVIFFLIHHLLKVFLAKKDFKAIQTLFDRLFDNEDIKTELSSSSQRNSFIFSKKIQFI